ncbi:MAG: hypothetical protein ACK4HW_02160 [Roseinatronobacter sp.]
MLAPTRALALSVGVPVGPLPMPALRLYRLALPLVLTSALGACLAGPDLPKREAATGQTPSLLPIAEVQRMAAGGSDIDAITAQSLARANALRARAAQLRGPVIAPGVRQSLLASVVPNQG